jgi:glyoxylase-like metal-dependent hydrolase (beta-lactamase superfamily II)
MNPAPPRQVRAGNRSPMTLDGTRTFVIGARHPVVIDPGPRDETHLRAVEEVLEGAVPRAILLTHAHADHSGNAVALAERTGAPLCMGRGALRLPFESGRVDHWLSDGDRIESDRGALRVVETPGHTPEHLSFLWENGGAATLFAGDLFLGVGDTTLVSRPEGSVGEYLGSLDRVAVLRPSVIYPAHGPALRRPEAAIRRFREHRLARIEEVRGVLRRRGRLSAEEMVNRVYGAALDPRLRHSARGSIEAILDYLDRRPGGG